MNRKPSDRFLPTMSSGQQVIGICIFLFIAVVCFALGVLVGRYEPSLEEKALDQMAGNAPPTSAPAGSQLSPRVDAAAPTPVPKTVRSPFTRPEETGPRITEVPPLPPPAARVTPEPVAAPASETPPAPAPGASSTSAAVSVTEATPAEPPAPASPASSSEPGLKQEEITLEPLEPTAVPLAPAAAPKTEPTPAAVPDAEGMWGLQLISLSNEKRAQEFRDKVNKSAKVEASILPTKDGKMFRVAVIGYKNEAAAKTALAGLKKKPEFKDALVKDFSKGQ